MASRSDITVLWNLSPRLIKIAAPSTDITIQDLHDTLRDIEDEPSNLIYPDLISSAGKEDLGGGVYVGLTSTLQNAQVMFERRTNLLESGTITTADSGDRAIQVIDSAADFVSAGVKRSDLVINLTDGSFCEVLTVDSPTQLTVLKPSRGVDNNFDFGDSYQVYEVVTCSVTGGNLVAVDELGTAINPVFPTFCVQITRTSSSSATLQELADIQYASFGGGITVDLTSPYFGVGYPNGTPRQPVNNLVDAVAIAVERGFPQLFILGDITFDSAVPSLEGYSIVGESANKSLFTIDPDADVANAEFTSATIQGTLDGGNVVADCVINDINFVDGFITRCVLNGTVTLSTQEDAHFLDCWSGVPGLSTPTIDFGGSGSGLALRNYNGGITLTNKSGPESVSIDMNSGQIVVEDTVTAGTIVLRGIGTWTNRLTYTGGANIVNQLIDPRDMQAVSFHDGVSIDVTSSNTGTTFPTGTEVKPVNNLADAKLIAEAQGFHKLYIIGNIAFAAGDDIASYTIVGQSASQSMVSVDPTTVTTNTQFFECLLTGSLAGGDNNIIRSGIAWNLYGFDGILFETMILGTLGLQELAGSRAALLSCYAGNPEDPFPIINLGSSASLIVRDFRGDIKLINKTGPEAADFDFYGSIEIDDTVNAGAVSLQGVGTWINEDTYAGSATISNKLVANAAIVDSLNTTVYDGVAFEDILKDLLAMASGRIIESPANTFTFYERDNSSPRFVLIKTGNERQRSP